MGIHRPYLEVPTRQVTADQVKLTVEFSKQICDGVQGVRNDFAGNPKVLN